MTIRPAAPGDAAAIAGVHVRAWRRAYVDIVDPERMPEEEDRRRRWAELLADAGSTVLVAEVADAVAGFCSLGPSRHEGAAAGEKGEPGGREGASAGEEGGSFAREGASAGEEGGSSAGEGAAAGEQGESSARGGGAAGAEGELYAIYVEPAAQGAGLGTALMVDAVAMLRAGGFTEAVVVVFEANGLARSFSEGGGWMLDGPHHAAGDWPPMVRYRRAL